MLLITHGLFERLSELVLQLTLNYGSEPAETLLPNSVSAKKEKEGGCAMWRKWRLIEDNHAANVVGCSETTGVGI